MLPIYNDEEFDKHLGLASLYDEKKSYRFKVENIEKTISKNTGYPMTIYDLKILGSKSKFPVKFYLVEIPKIPEDNLRGHYFQAQLQKSFINALGLPYNSNSVSQILNAEGNCTLKYEKMKDSTTSVWKVNKFLPKEAHVFDDPNVSVTSVPVVENTDDDIPF